MAKKEDRTAKTDPPNKTEAAQLGVHAFTRSAENEADASGRGAFRFSTDRHLRCKPCTGSCWKKALRSSIPSG